VGRRRHNATTGLRRLLAIHNKLAATGAGDKDGRCHHKTTATRAAGKNSLRCHPAATACHRLVRSHFKPAVATDGTREAGDVRLKA